MKQFEQKPIPENTFTLTDAELHLIHAMSFYFAQSSADETGMTKQAFKLVQKMEEQFRDVSYHANKDFQVWE